MVENPLNLLTAAWTAKVPRYADMLQAGGTGFNLLPVPFSTLGGWHPDVHRALWSAAITTAAKGLSVYIYIYIFPARCILFLPHVALLLANNSFFLIGLTSDI